MLHKIPPTKSPQTGGIVRLCLSRLGYLDANYSHITVHPIANRVIKKAKDDVNSRLSRELEGTARLVGMKIDIPLFPDYTGLNRITRSLGIEMEDHQIKNSDI